MTQFLRYVVSEPLTLIMLMRLIRAKPKVRWQTLLKREQWTSEVIIASTSGSPQVVFIFKLCLLMHLVNTGRSPQYLQELVTLTSDITSRSRLRSAGSRRYQMSSIRLKISERCFSFAGLVAWNSLPASLQDIRDHQAFKRNLKTELFNRV